MFASDALVWVISTASAWGRRAEDRLRGPVVVPLARPVLSPADISDPEARMSGLMLRDTMMVVRNRWLRGSNCCAYGRLRLGRLAVVAE